ncbi:MAG: hypothetical protein J6X05_02810 [Bacteroidales bacterium]|nr:hypothetical protein [Bacteroidales bacterium]
MNDSKTVFQSASANLELLLRQYKNQYPRNLGALLRNSLPILLIIVSVFILPLVTFFYSATSLNLGFLIAMFLVIPVLFVFSIILLINNKREKKTDPQLRQRIASLRQELDEYKRYPDVQKYFDGFDAQVIAVEKEKKHYRSRFWTILVVLFVVFALYGTFSIIWMKNYTNVCNHSVLGGTEILGLKKNVPFLILTPLTTDIGGGGKVESANVDFYYQENWLAFKEVNVSVPDTASILRLVITDRSGIPAPGCPRFIFKPLQNKAINSEPFCREDKASSSYTSNYFEGLKAARYLQAHKDNLYFLVEKVK